MECLTVASFNTWAGSYDGPGLSLVEYIKKLAMTHQVLGLQEVHRSNGIIRPKNRFVYGVNPGSRVGPIDTQLDNVLVAELKKTHNIFFVHHFRGAYHDCEVGLENVLNGNMVLVHKDCRVIGFNSGYIWGYDEINTEDRQTFKGRPGSRVAQCMTIQSGSVIITVMNIHGLWSANGKIDIPARDIQSSNIIELVGFHQSKLALKKRPPVLLLGDFNYTSQMKALSDLVTSSKLFPEGGVNLNAKFGITDTRTPVYEKLVREADFMIASRYLADVCDGVSIDNDAPSDHACLSASFRF